jgi:hypothetical protein
MNLTYFKNMPHSGGSHVRAVAMLLHGSSLKRTTICNDAMTNKIIKTGEIFQMLNGGT